MNEPKAYQEWNLNLLDNRLAGKVDYDEAPTDEELDVLAEKLEQEFSGVI